MKYRRRIYYSAAQRAEIWDRWQRGESMSSIGRAFDRESSSVFSVISPTGGTRPPDRKRGPLALSLADREEISRGLITEQSLRVIARHLGRAPSTISREVRRNGGRAAYRANTVDEADKTAPTIKRTAIIEFLKNINNLLRLWILKTILTQESAPASVVSEYESVSINGVAKHVS